MGQAQEISDADKLMIDTIDRAIQQQEVKLNALRKTRDELAQSIGYSPDPKTNEWEDKGILWAAEQWLQDVGEAKTTREIADAIRDRGVQTTSRNFLNTVYATLANATDRFVRLKVDKGKGGTWDLVHRKTKAKRKK